MSTDGGRLVGLGALIRLILRRDRGILPLWIIPLGLMPAGVVTAFDELFPTPAALAQFAGTMARDPAYVALLAPPFGASLGAVAAQRVAILFALVGLAAILVMVRHTRAEEEAGRRELLASAVVSRRAPLAAAALVTCAAALLCGGVATLGLLAQGLPVAGSLAFGAALGLTGCVFAGVGAVSGELARTAGGARGLGLGALAVFFLFRAVGDLAGLAGAATGGLSRLSAFSWVSPLGWPVQTRAFADERLGVLLLPLVAASGLFLVASRLAARRDLGAGILADRPGPAVAAPSLRTPLALALRLHRGLLVGWSLGLGTVGLLLGLLGKGVIDALVDNPTFLTMLAALGGGGEASDAYFSAMISFIGILAAGATIQAALRLRAEEIATRAELLLTAGVSRLGLAGAHLAVAAAAPVVGLLLFGGMAAVAFGLSASSVSEELARLVPAALLQLPAVWCFTGVAAALIGVAPRAAGATWGIFAATVFVGQFGPLLRLPSFALELSPFVHLPNILLFGGVAGLGPAELRDLGLLLAVALALLALGLVGYRRRDLTP